MLFGLLRRALRVFRRRDYDANTTRLRRGLFREDAITTRFALQCATVRELALRVRDIMRARQQTELCCQSTSERQCHRFPSMSNSGKTAGTRADHPVVAERGIGHTGAEHLEQTIGYMENSGNILIFSDIYDTRSGRGCNVTLLTEDSQSLRDLADRAGIWTELEERHPGLTPERILQGDHAVFGCIVIHDNLRTHGEFGLEFAGAAEPRCMRSCLEDSRYRPRGQLRARLGGGVPRRQWP